MYELVHIDLGIVTAQLRCPLSIEASHQDLDEIGFALNGEAAFRIAESVEPPGP